MAARLGGDLLLTLGVATATALLVTVPTLMSDAAPDRARVPTLTLLRDGKIGDRLAEFASVGEEDFSVGRPLTPAALAMPMVSAWPEQGDWTPPRPVVAQAKAPAVASAVTLPPRRLAVLSEKKGQAVAAPLVILPPAAMITVDTAQAAEASGGDTSLRQLVVAPAMKVVDVVSGAAGSVQAAGSWTLTQANGLLPRW
jgi:hypothetical protein